MTAQPIHATTADTAARAELNLGVRTAVALLVADQPSFAWNTLARSVERQARIHGVPGVHLGRAFNDPTGRWEVQR